MGLHLHYRLDSQTPTKSAPYHLCSCKDCHVDSCKIWYLLYLKMTDSRCCLEKLLQTVNVQMWLCRCTDALERLFVPTWAFQLLPPSLPPVCPMTVYLCYAAQKDGQGHFSPCRKSVLRVNALCLPSKGKLHWYRYVQSKGKRQMNYEGLFFDAFWLGNHEV